MPEKVFISSQRISNTCGIDMRKIDFKVLGHYVLHFVVWNLIIGSLALVWYYIFTRIF
jgi:SUMO ligase MMS21 Smc5/6 complex component